ncbi:MAG: hypothetical protein ACRDUA_21145 [Micromonosporaceae bacterium]
MRDGSGNRLDPVRLRPPRPRSLLRYAVIAALLVLAAGVLFLEPHSGTAERTECAPNARPEHTGATPSGSPSDRQAVLPVPSGHVGVPVQLAEPATAAVLRPGLRVDVIARTGRAAPGSPTPSNDEGGEAPGDAENRDGEDGEAEPGPAAGNVVLARNVLVLAVNADPAGSPDEGVLYLAVAAAHAERVATIAPEIAVGVTVRPD